jgi:hypothetical protein
MTLKRIRLELARDKQFPNGSRKHGYDFAAPLDDAGHLLADEWREHRDRCIVKRFWEGEPNEIGHLIHKRGGTWAFDYKPGFDADDERGFKFDKHNFVPGEYVSITEHDGIQRTFRIASVQDLD